jgi:hypothetical protein
MTGKVSSIHSDTASRSSQKHQKAKDTKLRRAAIIILGMVRHLDPYGLFNMVIYDAFEPNSDIQSTVLGYLFRRIFRYGMFIPLSRCRVHTQRVDGAMVCLSHRFEHKGPPIGSCLYSSTVKQDVGKENVEKCLSSQEPKQVFAICQLKHRPYCLIQLCL